MRRARFRWGNAETYTRFFQDYKRFLARPAQVGRDWSQKIGRKERIYIVKLDLAKFYDTIDRAQLIGALKHHYQEYAQMFAMDYDATKAALFWRRAEQALNWAWLKEDESNAPLFGAESLPKGLPQGLVAAGFFR